VRVLLALPLCLFLHPSYPEEPLAGIESATQLVPASERVVDSSLPNPSTHPVAFLEACLKRYDDKKIQGYSLVFQKQERIDGELKREEVVIVRFREMPYSVYFFWNQPANRDVRSALYVEGENKGSDGKSRVKVYTSFGFKLDKAPDGAEARTYSRYAMPTFGLRQTMQRVLDSWKEAQAENTLGVEYLGQEVVQEVGGRKCYKFLRPRYARPEGDDFVSKLIIFIDCETLFQVGSIVFGRDGEKLGFYYFRDIELNPAYPPEQFTSAALGKKLDNK
jgi:Protein of unknown function (DUF1571)